MYGWIYGWICECIDGCMDGYVEVWMDVWMDMYMYGWTYGPMHVYVHWYTECACHIRFFEIWFVMNLLYTRNRICSQRVEFEKKIKRLGPVRYR